MPQQGPVGFILFAYADPGEVSDPWGDSLAMKRADSARAALALYGVWPQHVSVVVYGSTHRPCLSDTDEQRSGNRLVEVLISHATARSR